MKIQTVLGPIEATQLGRVLTHEHFNLDFRTFHTAPPEQLKEFLNDKITLKNVGYIKQWPYSNRDNLQLHGPDVDVAIMEEMKLYKKFGGGTVVENTSLGLKRNIPLMIKVNKELGVNVIAGTGYYVDICQASSNLNLNVEAMCGVMQKEITEGCLDYPEVKCGIIGEVGSSWPISDFERRAIIASAHVHTSLNCPVTFHPARTPEAPFEIIRIFQEAGGNVKKAVMSHIDRTLKRTEDVLEFASLGSFCQLDMFGTECSYYQLNSKFDMPSDAQRVDIIASLISEGREDKILVSHDIHTKHRLSNFGGHGFSHIMNNVVPKMLIKGIHPNVVDKMLIKNPAAWLTGTV